MLIWTTKGPKRAEKNASKQPPEEAFAESSTAEAPAAGRAKSDKKAPSADVFLDRPPKSHQAAAVDDGDWSSAETPRAKTPETAG